MHAAAERIVPVSLELGGKSPAIVFPDADDARIVDGVISGNARDAAGAIVHGRLAPVPSPLDLRFLPRQAGGTSSRR